MDNLTKLLLTLNTMDKLPVEILKEISDMVLNKPVMKAVLSHDNETLKSIGYFDPDRIKDEQMKICFYAIRRSRDPQRDDTLLRWFDGVRDLLKTEKPRRPKHVLPPGP